VKGSRQAVIACNSHQVTLSAVQDKGACLAQLHNDVSRRTHGGMAVPAVRAHPMSGTGSARPAESRGWRAPAAAGLISAPAPLPRDLQQRRQAEGNTLSKHGRDRNRRESLSKQQGSGQGYRRMPSRRRIL
jgi:hypothetical protein